MKKPVIHVKYCGGCNPTFERKKVVRHIEGHFGFHVDPADESIIPDILLIVNGCKSECLLAKDFRSRKQTILIDDIGNLERIVEEIEDIIG